MFNINLEHMKKPITSILIFLVLLSFTTAAQESKCSVTAGADLVSNYIWRGSKFGKGPAIQPGIKLNAGGFTLGAWGSYCLSDEEAPEADLYTSYSFGPVSIGLSGYYFPGSDFFKTENHAFEINGGLKQGILSLSANWILNEGAGSKGNDLYFEAGIAAGKVNLTAGAGNGWYTPSGKFNLCNLGISTTKEISVTDSFKIPLTGSAILNPATEQFFIVVGISL
jgi:hypothetical protein